MYPPACTHPKFPPVTSHPTLSFPCPARQSPSPSLPPLRRTSHHASLHRSPRRRPCTSLRTLRPGTSAGPPGSCAEAPPRSPPIKALPSRDSPYPPPAADAGAVDPRRPAAVPALLMHEPRIRAVPLPSRLSA